MAARAGQGGRGVRQAALLGRPDLQQPLAAGGRGVLARGARLLRLAVGADRDELSAAERGASGKPRRGAGKGADMPIPASSIRPRATPSRATSARTTPVGLFAEGSTPEGVADLTGNVWDWTSSAYLDYPYEADPRARGSDASKQSIAWCAAARGTTIVPTPARRTATGTTRALGTTTSAFVLCVVPPLFLSSALCCSALRSSDTPTLTSSPSGRSQVGEKRRGAKRLSFARQREQRWSGRPDGVVRGGSWNNNRADARAAYRNRNNPGNRNNNIGFRVVRALRQVLPPFFWFRCLHRDGGPVPTGARAVPEMPQVHGCAAEAKEEGQRRTRLACTR